MAFSLQYMRIRKVSASSHLPWSIPDLPAIPTRGTVRRSPAHESGGRLGQHGRQSRSCRRLQELLFHPSITYQIGEAVPSSSEPMNDNNSQYGHRGFSEGGLWS